jgi:hypothetical protein
MLVMRTTENPADPVGELVSAQQTVGLDHFALAVNPFGLYSVQPRALLGQQAAYDPHSSFAAALFDLLAVMFSEEPAPELLGDVPACVVPDENQDLLANSFELFAAPRKKLSRYGTDGPAIHEPQPRLREFRHIEPVTADGFRFGVVFGDRLLDEVLGLPFLGPATQSGQGNPTPPAFVLETGGPPRIGLSHRHPATAISRSRRLFFFRTRDPYKGSGEVIHRLALCQRTPRRRAKVARMVSPETRFRVSPSSKATSAAIASVQRLESRPNSLGERCSSPLKASALWWSKASWWVRLGREEPGVRASRPLSLKSWIASRTVCWPHPRFLAICGTSSPPRTRQKHLRTAQGERVFGAQPGFKPLGLFL